MAQVCQPLAQRLPKTEARAASSSRWKGWGSNCRAKSRICSRVGVTEPSSRRLPTSRSSQCTLRAVASISGRP